MCINCDTVPDPRGNGPTGSTGGGPSTKGGPYPYGLDKPPLTGVLAQKMAGATGTTTPWPDHVKVTVGDPPTDVHIPWVDPHGPVREMTFQSTFRRIFDEAFDLLVAKQRTYGSANVEQLGFYGIFSRLAADKIERLRNLMNGKVVNGKVVLDFDGGDFGMGESVEDTILDCANYAFILLALKRGLWGRPLGPD